MVIEKNTILYFSGTGNSLQVAKDIGNLMNFDLLKLTLLRGEENILITANIIGVVFPVYYAHLPLIVEEIVKKLKLNKNVYVFAVATNGGGPATVLKKLKTNLEKNGATLNAGFLLHMPGNHVFGYNPKAVTVESKVFRKEKEKVEKIFDVISQRKNYKCEVSKLVIDTILVKVLKKSVDKILNGLRVRDTKFWVDKSCNGCRLCEKICPVGNIEFKEKLIWKHNCEQCTACIQYCPQQAIQWGKKTIKRRRYRNPNIDVNELKN